MKKNILITGGAGFIGSHLVRLLVNKYPKYHINNMDVLTYAGNLENLEDIENAPNYTFIKANITDADTIESLFSLYKFDSVIHLAAESHVDRSITDPLAFVNTNVLGTINLLNAFRLLWGSEFVPQIVLALRGSYGVGFSEGPWTRIRCGDAAGQHFPFILRIQNLCHSQKIIFLICGIIARAFIP